MNTFETTGGARIGTANASWPFATLKVDKDKLELNVSIIGNLIFQAKDIISITPHSSIISSGLKITHRVSEYKSEVIFWTFGNTTEIVNQINQTGFFDNINNQNQITNQSIIERQKSGSFPLKKTFSISIIVIWNALFLYDFVSFFTSNRKGMPLGNGSIIALVIILLVSILLLISKNFGAFVLKKERTVKDVNRFLYMLIFICITMLTVILITKT